MIGTLVSYCTLDAILRCLLRIQKSNEEGGLEAVTLPAYLVMAKLSVKGK